MAEEPESERPPSSTATGADPSIIPPTLIPSDLPDSPNDNPTLRRLTNAPQLPDTPPGERPHAGQRFGDFFLIEELGSGAFAVVFLAEQISLGRQVALKVARSSDN